MHMTHRGYLGDHHFFTNEECWYLTPENAFAATTRPTEIFPPHGGYTFEVTGKPTSFRGQFARPGAAPPRQHDHRCLGQRTGRRRDTHVRRRTRRPYRRR